MSDYTDDDFERDAAAPLNAGSHYRILAAYRALREEVERLRVTTNRCPDVDRCMYNGTLRARLDAAEKVCRLVDEHLRWESARGKDVEGSMMYDALAAWQAVKDGAE